MLIGTFLYMNLRKLKTLIDLISQSEIAEFEITEGEEKIRIVRSNPEFSRNSFHQNFPDPVPPISPKKSEKHSHIIKAPMVGTFYRSPSPGEPPFVDVGQFVKIGDTLCIVEAMKLLNEVEADIAGVIKEIIVENGEPIEYGQPLFVIG